MPEKKYDAIVVGSGATGGFAAKELAERGLEVLVLEAGPYLKEDVVPQRRRLRHEGFRSLSRVVAGLSQRTAQAGERVLALLSREGLPVRERQKEPLHRSRGATTISGFADGTWADGSYPGAASPSACRTTTSKRRAATDSARTGPSPTTNSSPTTTRWRTSSGSSAPATALPNLPDGKYVKTGGSVPPRAAAQGEGRVRVAGAPRRPVALCRGGSDAHRRERAVPHVVAAARRAADRAHGTQAERHRQAARHRSEHRQGHRRNLCRRHHQAEPPGLRQCGGDLRVDDRIDPSAC